MSQRGCLRKGGGAHILLLSNRGQKPAHIFEGSFLVIFCTMNHFAQNTMDPQKICLTILQAAIPLATRDLRRCPSTHCHKRLHGSFFFCLIPDISTEKGPIFYLEFQADFFSPLCLCTVSIDPLRPPELPLFETEKAVQ